jgi:hypothetical protein
MRDAKGEHPARAQHAEALPHRQVEARTVHQGHERDHRVEGRIGEHAEICVGGARVADPQRSAALLFLRQLDHPLGDVDPGHVRATTGEEPRVVALTASGVEHLLATQVANERHERRVVQPFAGDVMALANLPGPRRGIVVPMAGHVFFGELVLAHRREGVGLYPSAILARSVETRNALTHQGVRSSMAVAPLSSAPASSPHAEYYGVRRPPPDMVDNPSRLMSHC